MQSPHELGGASGGETRKSLNILLVDSNVVDVRLIEECIRVLRVPCQIHIASTAGEVGGVLEASRPDLIFLDIAIGDHEGFQLLSFMRTHPELRTVPVIVFTASHTQSDVEKAYVMGANAYVRKPRLDYFDTLADVVRFWCFRAELHDARTAPAESEGA